MSTGPEPSGRRNSVPLIAAAAVALVVAIVAVLFLIRDTGQIEYDGFGSVAEEDIANEATDSALPQCAAQAGLDTVKRELFRRAAGMRGRDLPAFERVAAFSALRLDGPAETRPDELGCAATVILDLPPGLIAGGRRRTLSAQIVYQFLPTTSAGNSVLIEGADSIIEPLSNLARQRVAEPAPLPETAPGDVIAVDPLAPETEEAVPQSHPDPATQPSFNCSMARTRGEIAVCRDPGLAALDRQMAEQYRTAIARGGPAQRRLLQRTRDDFLRFRDQCPSDSCIVETYRGRMREIRDILADRWRPPRN